MISVLSIFPGFGPYAGVAAPSSSSGFGVADALSKPTCSYQAFIHFILTINHSSPISIFDDMPFINFFTFYASSC
jgi:hypothetical protein